MITAEKKIKRQQNGNVHEYVYYHCTKRKDPTCRQPAIREDRLAWQIERLLAAIEIPEHFRIWGLDYIASRSQDHVADWPAPQAARVWKYRLLESLTVAYGPIIQPFPSTEVARA